MPANQASDAQVGDLLRSVANAIRTTIAESSVERALVVAANACVQTFGLTRADAWRIDRGQLSHLAASPHDGVLPGNVQYDPPAVLASVEVPMFVGAWANGRERLGALMMLVSAGEGAGLGVYPVISTDGTHHGCLTVVHDSHDPSRREALALFTQQLGLHVQHMSNDTETTTVRSRLASAQRLTRQLSTAETREELFSRLVDGAQRLFDSSRAAVYFPPAGMPATDDGPWDSEACGEVSSHEHERRLVDAARAGLRMRVVRTASMVCWAVPIVVNDQVQAVLYAELDATIDMDAGNREDRSLLRGLVDHATAALGSIASAHELEKNHQSTIQALASALEATDQYTSDHSGDVAAWAVDVGRRLGLKGAALRELELGAVFHDIGKIAIPTDILNKPGSLTDEEFEVMKTHTVIGERIISPLEFLRNVAPIVRHEHERWDGTGYPDGLSGTDIPLGSRIIFVCDAYHAITSDRPYRRARSHDVARRILQENAGTQFDPAVVQVFLEVVEAAFAQGNGQPPAPSRLLSDDLAA
jgi:HD-GYP domain-containing protein (c-di-GMP phosphodiesterase class II)